MALWRAIIVAIVNGLTEVLPISVFGHIEILKAVMVDYSDSVKMIVRFSCVGVILAIALVYRRALAKLGQKNSRKELLWVLLMGLPSTILFCLLEGKFPWIFYSLWAIAAILLTMSLMMLNFEVLAKIAKKKTKAKISFSNSSAVVSGLLASTSILPGFSRVAILTMASRLYGEKREAAFERAILASLPVLVAMVVKCLCYGGVDFVSNNAWQVLASIAVAFVLSLLALIFARKINKKSDVLRVFGWYQLMLALVVLVFKLIK